ncbi:MAG: exo-alpha-sialidase [Armatimonadetes bacterium]|nr:exo-alpha-sialidase [Armatimonadota bacterium]
MKHLLLLAFAVSAACVYAQDPIMGGQLRMSVDNASNSGDETSGSSSLDGSEIVGGFNDYRTDGTIKSSFGVSSDGGQSWAQIVLRPPVQNQTTVEGDPMACYDKRTNTLFAGAMAFGSNGGIYIARKNAGQNSFSTAVMARINGSVDKGWMDAGPLPGNPNSTRLYITFNQGVIRSDDLGNTWTAPFSLGSGLGFLPRVGPNGELYVTYWDTSLGIKFRRSLDGGQTWSNAVSAATRLATWGVQNYGIPGNFRNPPIHTMAVSPTTGDIVIVYFDQTNVVNNQRNLDLYLTRSTDKGVTWSVPARLPYRNINTVSDMIFPWVEFTREGRLNVLCFDTSRTPNQTDGVAAGFWDQDYFYSDDEGANWSQIFRLTPNAFNSFNDGRNAGTSFMGDYNGMGIGARHVYPVYLDTRTNQAEIYTNKIINRIEIPSTFQWLRGQQLGGNLQSLFLKDGNSATAKPGLTLTPGEPPIQLVTTTTGIVNTTPSVLSVWMWSMVNTPNIEMQTMMQNINTQNWDVVDVRPAPQALTNIVVNVPNPANYITPGSGTANCRVTWKAVGPVPNPNWVATVDQNVLVLDP